MLQGTLGATRVFKKNELSQLPEETLPRLTQVWRWVKNLLSAYITLRKENTKLSKILHRNECKIDTDDDFERKEDVKRVLTLVKQTFKLSRKTSLRDLEAFLFQRPDLGRNQLSMFRALNSDPVGGNTS